MRNKIKTFANTKVTLPPGRHKIIILDEADSMTPGAQQALRRTMEIYSNSTRFALACNHSSKIIEPIQSRCAILRYGKLSDQEILKRLVEICDAEQVRSLHLWSGLYAAIVVLHELHSDTTVLSTVLTPIYRSNMPTKVWRHSSSQLKVI